MKKPETQALAPFQNIKIKPLLTLFEIQIHDYRIVMTSK